MGSLTTVPFKYKSFPSGKSGVKPVSKRTPPREPASPVSPHHLSQRRPEVSGKQDLPKPRPFNQSFLHRQKSGALTPRPLRGSRTSVSPGGRTRLPTHRSLLKTRTDGQTDETGPHPSLGFKPRPRKTRNHAPKRSYSELLQGHSERSAVTAGAPRVG